MTDFDAKWLGEPSLKFGDGEAKDPRAGLLQYGPWSPGDGNSSTDIYVGFLGTSQSISAVKSLFKQMETSIPEKLRSLKGTNLRSQASVQTLRSRPAL